MPGPCPSVECSPAIVGFGVVPQHIPLAVTAAPPSLVISPPLVMELIVILVPGLVMSVGSVGSSMQLFKDAIPITRIIKWMKADLFLISDPLLNTE